VSNLNDWWTKEYIQAEEDFAAQRIHSTLNEVSYARFGFESGAKWMFEHLSKANVPREQAEDLIKALELWTVETEDKPFGNKHNLHPVARTTLEKWKETNK
jgi:hypothetical protein